MTEAVTNVSLQFWDSIDFSQVFHLTCVYQYARFGMMKKGIILKPHIGLRKYLSDLVHISHLTGSQQIRLPVLGTFSTHIFPGSRQYIFQLLHLPNLYSSWLILAWCYPAWPPLAQSGFFASELSSSLPLPSTGELLHLILQTRISSPFPLFQCMGF